MLRILAINCMINCGMQVGQLIQDQSEGKQIRCVLSAYALWHQLRSLTACLCVPSKREGWHPHFKMGAALVCVSIVLLLTG
jgi:hypothetical protein